MMNSDQVQGRTEGSPAKSAGTADASGRNPVVQRLLISCASVVVTVALTVGGMVVAPAWAEGTAASAESTVATPTAVSASPSAVVSDSAADGATANTNDVAQAGESAQGTETGESSGQEPSTPETVPPAAGNGPGAGTNENENAGNAGSDGNGGEESATQPTEPDQTDDAADSDASDSAIETEPEEGDFEVTVSEGEYTDEETEAFATGEGYNWYGGGSYRTVTIRAVGGRADTSSAASALNGAVFVAAKGPDSMPSGDQANAAHVPPATPAPASDVYYCTTGMPQGNSEVVDGSCTIRIPRNPYWIMQYSAPDGYFMIDELTVGRSVSLSTGRYAFLVNSTTTVPSRAASYTYPSVTYSGVNYRDSSNYWANVRNNPEFPLVCDPRLNIALVLDTSGSLDSTEITSLKDAAKAFVSSAALGLTQTTISIVQFSTEAKVLLKEQSIETTEGIEKVQGVIDDLDEKGEGGTNWDHAFRTVAGLEENYDAAIMITDGNPTFAQNNANNGQVGSGNVTSPLMLESSTASANMVKASGTAVLTVGVGVDANSESNLLAISGAGDVYNASNYQVLEAELRSISQRAQCQATITVQKLIDDGITEKPVPASDWEMTTG